MFKKKIRLVNPGKMITGILIVSIATLVGGTIVDYRAHAERDKEIQQIKQNNKEIDNKLDKLLKQQKDINKDLKKYEEKVDDLERRTVEQENRNKKYVNYIASYNSGNPKHLLKYMKKAYKEFNLQSYGLRFSTFVAQARVESKYNPNETGSNGDIGLYQILPSTARAINKMYFRIPNFTPQMLYSPELNARFSAYYLTYIFNKGYSVGDTLESYNKWIVRGTHCSDYRGRVFAAERSIL
jgi:soluble lytic murein transglycosylase-like protein